MADSTETPFPHDPIAEHGDLLTTKEAQARIDEQMRESQAEIEAVMAWGRRHSLNASQLPPAVAARLCRAEARLSMLREAAKRYQRQKQEFS